MTVQKGERCIGSEAAQVDGGTSGHIIVSICTRASALPDPRVLAPAEILRDRSHGFAKITKPGSLNIAAINSDLGRCKSRAFDARSRNGDLLLGCLDLVRRTRCTGPADYNRTFRISDDQTGSLDQTPDGFLRSEVSRQPRRLSLSDVFIVEDDVCAGNSAHCIQRGRQILGRKIIAGGDGGLSSDR